MSDTRSDLYHYTRAEITELIVRWTERRRAEQALRFSQERFSLAMEAANEGLWDWHLPSGRGYFSPRYCAMLGFEPEELSPNYATWKGLLHPEDREAADLELQR